MLFASSERERQLLRRLEVEWMAYSNGPPKISSHAVIGKDFNNDDGLYVLQ
jgi:hypothetical protein